MKKVILLTAIVAGIGFSAMSQVNPHAIGIRGGSGNYGSGAEISYQHGLGDANRLELDLGLRNNTNHQHFILSGIYHWVWNLTDGLNWYAGLGGQLGMFQHKFAGNEDGLTLAVGGQLGIEFDFNDLGAPILISLDTRPMWGFLSNGGAGYGGAFGIRYTF